MILWQCCVSSSRTNWVRSPSWNVSDVSAFMLKHLLWVLLLLMRSEGFVCPCWLLHWSQRWCAKAGFEGNKSWLPVCCESSTVNRAQWGVRPFGLLLSDWLTSSPIPFSFPPNPPHPPPTPHTLHQPHSLSTSFLSFFLVVVVLLFFLIFGSLLNFYFTHWHYRLHVSVFQSFSDDSDSSDQWGPTPQQDLGAESVRATEDSTGNH